VDEGPPAAGGIREVLRASLVVQGEGAVDDPDGVGHAVTPEVRGPSWSGWGWKPISMQDDPSGSRLSGSGFFVHDWCRSSQRWMARSRVAVSFPRMEMWPPHVQDWECLTLALR
jgi:hypothetical protein